jgi:hypothetical protein
MIFVANDEPLSTSRLMHKRNDVFFDIDLVNLPPPVVFEQIRSFFNSVARHAWGNNWRNPYILHICFHQ